MTGPRKGGGRPARRPFVVALLALAVGLTACSSTASREGSSSAASSARPSSSVPDTYGDLPTFLPTPTVAADALTTGSPGHPAVISQGETVLARVPGGTVHVQVTGPVVPGEGLPKVQEATTATWTVVFDRATTTVPIRLHDFLALDEDAHSYDLEFVPGARRPPARLRPGQRVAFAVRVVIATGEGVMRWQPNGRPLAVWDFVVEND